MKTTDQTPTCTYCGRLPSGHTLVTADGDEEHLCFYDLVQFAARVQEFGNRLEMRVVTAEVPAPVA